MKQATTGVKQGTKETNRRGLERIFSRMRWTQMKWKSHDTKGPALYVVGRLSSQLFHIAYFQSNFGREVYHMVNDKDNKKLMKRAVPVNMLLKREFLLSAESSWNSSSFIWNPGCKKKGPLHKLTTSRRRSTSPNSALHHSLNLLGFI